MDKFITLNEKDFVKLENGYNFIKKNREEIYELIKDNKELSKKFEKFFPSKKIKSIPLSL